MKLTIHSVKSKEAETPRAENHKDREKQRGRKDGGGELEGGDYENDGEKKRLGDRDGRHHQPPLWAHRPGLSGNLTDSEGFPRKILTSLSQEQKDDVLLPLFPSAELKNDHKEITEKINENIQVLHSVRFTPKSPSSKDSGVNEASGQISSLHSSVVPALGNTSAPMDVDFIVGMPFAVVGEISDNSPTADAEDGLQLGDQIVKFGALEYQSGENMLQKLASEALTNQGHTISLVVLRQGSPVNLTITPREWQGRGLLGCSFRAL